MRRITGMWDLLNSQFPVIPFGALPRCEHTPPRMANEFSPVRIYSSGGPQMQNTLLLGMLTCLELISKWCYLHLVA
jgi:hypothetical protein